MASYALIADPDTTRAAMYAGIARDEGLTPIVAKDGAAAAAALSERGAPALAVVELSLPALGGFDLIERIRRLAPPSKSPVIAVSDQRELRDTATERRSRLGIAVILARAASADSVRRVVKVLLTESGDDASGARAKAAPAPAPMRAPTPTPVPESGMVDPLKALVERAARELHVPVVLVALRLGREHTLKASVGVDERDAARLMGLLRDPLGAREPMVISDLAAHPALGSYPAVRAGIARGYAGAPILGPSGEVLGTLAIVRSKQTLLLGPEAQRRLGELARAAATALTSSTRSPVAPQAPALLRSPAALPRVVNGFAGRRAAARVRA